MMVIKRVLRKAVLVLSFWFSAANASWIVDPHQYLDYQTTQHLNQSLTESASRRGIGVVLFILKEDESEIKKQIVGWGNTYLEKKQLRQIAYLVINPIAQKSWVMLGPSIELDPRLLEGIASVHQIIRPSLLAEKLSKAALEGTIGLSTLLEKEPSFKPVPDEAFYAKTIKWFINLLLIYAVWVILKSYLSRPHWYAS